MAYTEFTATLPDGSHTGPTVIGEIVNNLLALRDKDMVGGIAGFAVSQSGGTAEEPATFFLKNGAIWLRGTPTWSAGSISSILWEWSNDTGGTFATVFTLGSTIDGSGNVTATSGAGGLLWTFVNALLGKFKALRTAYNSHAATTGAHSTGTMALQNANAVAITDGAATLTTARSKTHDYGSIGAGVSLDWKAGDYAKVTVTGSGAAFNSHTNAPGGGDVGSITMLIVNGGLATTLFPGFLRPGGSLSLSASGTDLVSLIHDGTNKIVLPAKGLA
jgi:hypothetical protein